MHPLPVIDELRSGTRIDTRADQSRRRQRFLWFGTVLAAAVVLAWGGGTRDLNQAEATVGVAATERVAAFGQALNGWIVTLPAARVLPSWCAAWLFGSEARGQTLLVHLPAHLASLGLVILAMSRVRQREGTAAAMLVGLALATSLALNERPMHLGFDPVVGLFLVGAIDRILTRGSDLVAGLWTAVAALMGGWPALVIVALPTLVLGRAGAYLSWRLVLPPVVALVGWSAWAITTVSAEVWGAWLVAPLKQPIAWELVPWVAALALPWTPFLALVAFPSIRDNWSEPTRRWVMGWVQTLLALTLAGTLLPGLVTAAMPMSFGLIVVACCALSRAAGVARGAPRMLVLLGAFGLCMLGGIVAIPYASFLAAAMPYYRVVTIIVALAMAFAFAISAVAAWQGRLRWSVACLVILALTIKLAHGEIYSPEWSYRLGQGPWGRAIGQWVPPREPIYTVHSWPVEFAFATEHSVRTLVAPGWLDFVGGPGPHYVLLLDTEFENWPPTAAKLEKVRAFLDANGRTRVLARTLETAGRATQ